MLQVEDNQFFHQNDEQHAVEGKKAYKDVVDHNIQKNEFQIPIQNPPDKPPGICDSLPWDNNTLVETLCDTTPKVKVDSAILNTDIRYRY